MPASALSIGTTIGRTRTTMSGSARTTDSCLALRGWGWWIYRDGFSSFGEINRHARSGSDRESPGMKRIGNLYNKVASLDNLYQAYLEARKAKRKKRSCFLFETSLAANLEALHRALAEKTYHPLPYGQFFVYEPKPRLIYAPHFKDIVVQHAVYRHIYPIYDKRFVSTTFACRKGYGTHRASDYVQRSMRAASGDLFYLQLDIRRYFYSINREYLYRLLSATVKDNDLLGLMAMFAVVPGEDLGIPIGNLLSQLYAGVYLSPVDHFIKRDLRVSYYARYVDDLVLIGLTRQQAEENKAAIEEFLRRRLGLTFSKWRIAKISKGINFVGYRTWRSSKFIRKYSLYKFTKKIRQNDQKAVNSLLGHAKNTQSLPGMVKKLSAHPTLCTPKSFLLPGSN